MLHAGQPGGGRRPLSITHPGSGATILLVDDDPRFAEDVALLLGDQSELIWITGSREALEAIARNPAATILLDLNMPRFLGPLDEDEGLELLERIDEGRRRDVIVVTQSLTAAARWRLPRLGVSRVYIKSESLGRLRELIGQGRDDAG